MVLARLATQNEPVFRLPEADLGICFVCGDIAQNFEAPSRPAFVAAKMTQPNWTWFDFAEP